MAFFTATDVVVQILEEEMSMAEKVGENSFKVEKEVALAT